MIVTFPTYPLLSDSSLPFLYSVASAIGSFAQVSIYRDFVRRETMLRFCGYTAFTYNGKTLAARTTRRISRVSHSSRSATINTVNASAVSNAGVSAFLGGVDGARGSGLYYPREEQECRIKAHGSSDSPTSYIGNH